MASIPRKSYRHVVTLAIMTSVMGLAGCQKLEGFDFLKPKTEAADEDSVGMAARSVKLVERDVEAPEVFSATEAGLWDGRPSLGGVWVAHPDVRDPERVIIRNATNDKFVIGALFRRERANPGPRIQVSSDAAAALGLLAGQPIELNVTALRRESVPVDPPAETQELLAPDEITSAALDPVQSAAAGIKDDAPKPVKAAAAAPKPAQAAAPAAPKPAAAKPAAKPRAAGLDKPYIQIGIFSIEANANATADRMRKAGMVPTVKKQTSKGKTFWRVLIGPATNSSERGTLLAKIKKTGFTDAYAVTN